MRYFFEISYKGTNYHGWQIQKNAISIQELIQNGLKKLLRYEVEIAGSGRTDAGVHAKQQYFHADIEGALNCADFAYKLNAVLPHDIFISAIRKVRQNAHARFDAILRAYDYVMVNKRDPFLLNEAYIYHSPLDIDMLNKASQLLVGKHDFESFSKVKTQVNNFNCEIFQAFWKQEDNRITFHIEANRFLRGMVRAMVGTLLMVNERKIGLNDLKGILESKNRGMAGQSISPDGLYLSKVNYPVDIFES